MTVFETLDDDIFDGNIGEDDEETPRIRVGFAIKAEDVLPQESEEPKRKSAKDRQSKVLED